MPTAGKQGLVGRGGHSKRAELRQPDLVDRCVNAGFELVVTPRTEIGDLHDLSARPQPSGNALSMASMRSASDR